MMLYVSLTTCGKCQHCLLHAVKYSCFKEVLWRMIKIQFILKSGNGKLSLHRKVWSVLISPHRTTVNKWQNHSILPKKLQNKHCYTNNCNVNAFKSSFASVCWHCHTRKYALLLARTLWIMECNGWSLSFTKTRKPAHYIHFVPKLPCLFFLLPSFPIPFLFQNEIALSSCILVNISDIHFGLFHSS